MNQSDIRGLVRHQQTRADIDILRREYIAFSNREFSPPETNLSHSVVAYYSYSCLHLSVSYLYSIFRYQKIWLRRLGDEKNC